MASETLQKLALSKAFLADAYLIYDAEDNWVLWLQTCVSCRAAANKLPNVWPSGGGVANARARPLHALCTSQIRKSSGLHCNMWWGGADDPGGAYIATLYALFGAIERLFMAMWKRFHRPLLSWLSRRDVFQVLFAGDGSGAFASCSEQSEHISAPSCSSLGPRLLGAVHASPKKVVPHMCGTRGVRFMATGSLRIHTSIPTLTSALNSTHTNRSFRSRRRYSMSCTTMSIVSWQWAFILWICRVNQLFAMSMSCSHGHEYRWACCSSQSGSSASSLVRYVQSGYFETLCMLSRSSVAFSR